MSEPMSEERLTQLDALERPDLDPLESTHIISPGYTHLANLTEEIGEGGKPRGRCIGMMPKEWADYIAAAVNAFPELLAEVRRLQAQAQEIESILTKNGHGRESWGLLPQQIESILNCAEASEAAVQETAEALQAELARERQRAEQETARADYCKEMWHSVETAARIVITERDQERQRAEAAEAKLVMWAGKILTISSVTDMAKLEDLARAYRKRRRAAMKEAEKHG